MASPRLKLLRYRLSTADDFILVDPLALDTGTDTFDLHLADGLATITLKGDFWSPEEGQHAVEPFLRGWEIHEALHRRHQVLWFSYENCEFETLPGGVHLGVATVCATASLGPVETTVTAREYPRPPDTFLASPLMQHLWQLYEGYLRGQDRLLPMAYSCLSLVEWSVEGSRDKAAKQYGFSKKVLSKLGDLTAHLGTAHSARKFDAESKNREPTRRERAWIEATIEALIRRVAEWEADTAAARKMITMKDLPGLDEKPGV